jgi:hypothetical protein
MLPQAVIRTAGVIIAVNTAMAEEVSISESLIERKGAKSK